MKSATGLCLALLLTSFGVARAQSPLQQPDLLSIGAGDFDFNRVQTDRRSAEMRAEYRWGLSLLPMVSDAFAGLDRYVQVHPEAGVMGSTRGQLYGFGGIAIDAIIARHLVLTLAEAVGAYSSGNTESLGSTVEFRTQVEVGVRFDNGLRATTFFSHMSNSNIGRHNTGAESVGLYLTMPVRMLLPRG